MCSYNNIENEYILYFFCYFIFFYSCIGGSTYFIYTILNKDLINQTDKYRKLLKIINDRYDLFEEEMIDDMDIDLMIGYIKSQDQLTGNS
tara:strand:+ start:939 stop:1208 length:270 start_codon:yes stop_codon:yes gene_type:complete